MRGLEFRVQEVQAAIGTMPLDTDVPFDAPTIWGNICELGSIVSTKEFGDITQLNDFINQVVTVMGTGPDSLPAVGSVLGFSLWDALVALGNAVLKVKNQEPNLSPGFVKHLHESIRKSLKLQEGDKVHELDLRQGKLKEFIKAISTDILYRAESNDEALKALVNRTRNVERSQVLTQMKSHEDEDLFGLLEGVSSVPQNNIKHLGVSCG